MDMTCPHCGGEVAAEYTCRTYGPNENGHWMSCLGCASAIHYMCMCWLHDGQPERQCRPGCECHWRYTHGLSPRNPRSEANEKGRPSWLTSPKPETVHGVAAKLPGIPWAWEDGPASDVQQPFGQTQASGQLKLSLDAPTELDPDAFVGGEP